MRCAWLLATCATGAACAPPPPPPAPPPPPPRHDALEAFALAPYDADAPTRARISRTEGGVLAEIIDVETSAWASPTRTLVRAPSGETWLETCDAYDAAQARCPQPIWIRVYPGAHVHRTTPPP